MVCSPAVAFLSPSRLREGLGMGPSSSFPSIQSDSRLLEEFEVGTHQQTIASACK